MGFNHQATRVSSRCRTDASRAAQIAAAMNVAAESSMVRGSALRSVWVLARQSRRVAAALQTPRPAAAVIAALVAKSKLPVDRIDDVVLGCANRAGEDNRNVARMAALLAGLPVGVPGVTVNRLCGSGMQAITDAARAVATGEAEL